jgi:hypothetical protein
MVQIQHLRLLAVEAAMEEQMLGTIQAVQRNLMVSAVVELEEALMVKVLELRTEVQVVHKQMEQAAGELVAPAAAEGIMAVLVLLGAVEEYILLGIMSEVS